MEPTLVASQQSYDRSCPFFIKINKLSNVATDSRTNETITCCKLRGGGGGKPPRYNLDFVLRVAAVVLSLVLHRVGIDPAGFS